LPQIIKSIGIEDKVKNTLSAYTSYLKKKYSFFGAEQENEFVDNLVESGYRDHSDRMN
jgi:hypothetical protein